jgi:ATP-binding cassette subfamily B protein
MTSDCQKLARVIPWVLLDLVWGSSLVLLMAGLMLWLDWRLALIVLAIVPPLIVVTIFFKRRLLRTSRLVRRTNSELTAAYNECLMGVRTTKILVREGENLREFQGLSEKMNDYSVRNALQSAVYLPMVISLGALGVGLALWQGGVVVVPVGGEGLSVGKLIAFMQYAAFFYMPIQEMAEQFTQLQSAQAAAERVQSLLETEPEIEDAPEVRARIAELAAAAAQSTAGQASRGTPLREPKPGFAVDGGAERIESIEFRDVSFWYKEGERVLDSFSLRVRSGETIALVGETGGGKSTIVSLAARFYEPNQGEVLINGVDYRKRGLSWLQSQLGVVLQSPHLFSGTVADNIRYGRLDASDDEIIAAARTANAHEFISQLDKGYETAVGEGGTLLSTGQRQLVSLARAVLADPQIIILDEATSSVDTLTERLIQRGIEELLEGRIAFVIAHRLSTIRSADRILVIDGGRIVEQGAHDALMAERGRYWRLYTNQFVREAGEGVVSV